jgi:hypothetical protein
MNLNWHDFCDKTGVKLQMAMNNAVGEQEIRRQHEESARQTRATRGNEWSSFRRRLADGGRLAVKTIFWLGVLAAVFNYRTQIAEFIVPAAKEVLTGAQHLGDHSQLKQALATPDKDLADITH